MHDFSLCMSVHHVCPWGLQSSEENIKCLELELPTVVSHPMCAQVTKL